MASHLTLNSMYNGKVGNPLFLKTGGGKRVLFSDQWDVLI